MNHDLDILLQNENYTKRLEGAIYVEPRDYRSIPNKASIRYFNRKGELKYAGQFCRFYDSEILEEKMFLISTFRRTYFYLRPIFYHVFYTPHKTKPTARPQEPISDSKKTKKYKKILVNLKSLEQKENI